MPLCLLQISQYILNIKINLINCMFKMTLYYVKVYNVFLFELILNFIEIMKQENSGINSSKTIDAN